MGDDYFENKGVTESYISYLESRYKVRLRLQGHNIFISTDIDTFYLDVDTFILYHEGLTKHNKLDYHVQKRYKKGKIQVPRLLNWVCKLASEHRTYIVKQKKSKQLRHIERMKKLYDKI